MKRIVKTTALVLALLLVAAAAGIFALWHNDLASVASFQKIRARNDAHMDGAVYELSVKDGFYLEDFIAQGGASNDSELISFVVDHITKGLIPVHIASEEDQKGLDRYRHIEGQLLAADGIVSDEQAAMDVLASVGRRDWNHGSGEHLTIHSAVYNLTDKTVDWVPNENYHDAEAWFTFAL